MIKYIPIFVSLFFGGLFVDIFTHRNNVSGFIIFISWLIVSFILFLFLMTGVYFNIFCYNVIKYLINLIIS